MATDDGERLVAVLFVLVVQLALAVVCLLLAIDLRKALRDLSELERRMDGQRPPNSASSPTARVWF